MSLDFATFSGTHEYFGTTQLPLETATLIKDLVTSNPAASDPLSASDDHMRLIKSVLKTQFPNLLAAITASDVDLNATTAIRSGTVPYLFPLGTVLLPGVTPVGDTDTGLWSPGANQLSASVGGVRAIGIAADKSVTFDGAVNVTGLINGPGSTIIGGMIMWLTDTLPTTGGTWCWANGGTLSRTGNGAALLAAWGGTMPYGTGDGSTTFNVINMQEVTPVGKSTMGGASSPGLLNSIGAGLKAVLGGLFGSDTNTLTVPQLPAHTHANTLSDPGHAHNTDPVTGKLNGGSFGQTSGTNLAVTAGALATSTNTTGVTINNASVGSGTAVNNVMPSRAVNFIIRIG
jgi:microcystin-dependent protein